MRTTRSAVPPIPGRCRPGTRSARHNGPGPLETCVGPPKSTDCGGSIRSKHQPAPAGNQKAGAGPRTCCCEQTKGKRKCPSQIIEMPNFGSRETVVASKELLGAIQSRDLIPCWLKICIPLSELLLLLHGRNARKFRFLPDRHYSRMAGDIPVLVSMQGDGPTPALPGSDPLPKILNGRIDLQGPGPGYRARPPGSA